MAHTVDQPITYDDAWFAGEDKTFTFTIKKADESAQDITGWTLEWELRLSRYAATSLLSKTVGSGITITNGPAGILTVALAQADTVSLKAGSYYHGLARTNGGSWDVNLEGQAILRKAAVRA